MQEYADLVAQKRKKRPRFMKKVSENQKQILLQFFKKFLGIAGLDEVFTEQVLQALQVIAAIACEHDYFFKAVAVAEQEF